MMKQDRLRRQDRSPCSRQDKKDFLSYPAAARCAAILPAKPILLFFL